MPRTYIGHDYIQAASIYRPRPFPGYSRNERGGFFNENKGVPKEADPSFLFASRCTYVHGDRQGRGVCVCVC